MSTIQLEPTRAFLDTRTPPSARDFHPDASIVLVGCRGSGKRSLGFIGATYLGRRLVTEDHYFLEATGISRYVGSSSSHLQPVDFLRSSFFQQYGNQNFHKKSVELFKRMLNDNRVNCIIECGMVTSLSTPAQKMLYEFCKTNPVIYVTRESECIRSLLRLGGEEASRLEIADRAHRNCSNLEYFNLFDTSCEGTETPPENGIGSVSSR